MSVGYARVSTSSQNLENQIDTTSPAGRLLFSMLGAIAEFEHDLINERVKDGIEALKKKSVHFGRKAILSTKEKF